MTLLSGAMIVLIGMFAGMLATIAIMAALLHIFVKIPGGRAARYWASGSGMILAASAFFTMHRQEIDYGAGMAIMGAFAFGHFLQWRGLQFFFGRQPSGRARWVGAAYWLAYSIPLMSHASFEQRLAYIALVPLVVWPLCVRELLRADHPPYTFATRLAGAGLGLMILDASVSFVVGVLPAVKAFLPQLRETDQVLVQALVPIIGSLLYMAALMLMFFRRAAEQANFAASHDELTGLLNRRALIEAGEREIEASRRAHRALTVAFIDIDFFKRINDTHGHDAGDAVLREAALVLTGTGRAIDFVGRYGGEEFCMIFPGDHHGGADIVGERIVVALRNHQFGLPDKVTVSVGLAVMQPGDSATTWHSLVSLADTELYKAKHGGRDCYRVHGAPAREGRSASRKNPKVEQNNLFMRYF